MSRIPRPRRTAALVVSAAALIALSGCGAQSEVATEAPKLEKILTGIDEYNGYGPTVIKVRQGLGEAEIAISAGLTNGMSLKDMTFDYFNRTLVRSSAYPGTIALNEVYGGLHPIMSVTEGSPHVVAISDDQSLCYYLRTTLDSGRAVFERGVAAVVECRADTIPDYTTWSPVGAAEWPAVEDLTIPEEFLRTAEEEQRRLEGLRYQGVDPSSPSQPGTPQTGAQQDAPQTGAAQPNVPQK